MFYRFAGCYCFLVLPLICGPAEWYLFCSSAGCLLLCCSSAGCLLICLAAWFCLVLLLLIILTGCTLTSGSAVLLLLLCMLSGCFLTDCLWHCWARFPRLELGSAEGCFVCCFFLAMMLLCTFTCV